MTLNQEEKLVAAVQEIAVQFKAQTDMMTKLLKIHEENLEISKQIRDDRPKVIEERRTYLYENLDKYEKKA